MFELSRLRLFLPVVVFVLLFVFSGCQEEEPSAELDSAPESAAGSAPAFDYPGGWLDEGACVDICGVTPESPVERPSAVVCFNPDDKDCASKTGVDDYDYLMLSQHWLPTMCMGLDSGYDSTVTHQAGAACIPGAPNRLTVHGLWPNYTAGFPQCCGSALPMDPMQAMGWSDELKNLLQEDQLDPTTASFEPALCEIFNHEWQKHGTCFVDTGDTNADAKKYFETGMELSQQLDSATSQLNTWAGTTQVRGAIEALYPKAVQVMCDSRQPERLLEIHTCWSRALEMVDCPYSKGFGSLKACGDEISLPALEI